MKRAGLQPSVRPCRTESGRGALKKVAIFGNTGGGKSTLAKRLASLTGLPLYALDLIQYRPGGEQLSQEEYRRAHADLISRAEWIIEGYGDTETSWERFDKADTLIHIDLPMVTHYWWVTKRFVKALYVPPEGWPENSPLWKSTLNSYRVVQLCHRHLTPRYRQLTTEMAEVKRVHRLTSAAAISRFLSDVESELRGA